MDYRILAKLLDEVLEQEPIRSEILAVLQKHGWYQAVPDAPVGMGGAQVTFEPPARIGTDWLGRVVITECWRLPLGR